MTADKIPAVIRRDASVGLPPRYGYPQRAAAMQHNNPWPAVAVEHNLTTGEGFHVRWIVGLIAEPGDSNP